MKISVLKYHSNQHGLLLWKLWGTSLISISRIRLYYIFFRCILCQCRLIINCCNNFLCAINHFLVQWNERTSALCSRIYYYYFFNLCFILSSGFLMNWWRDQLDVFWVARQLIHHISLLIFHYKGAVEKHFGLRLGMMGLVKALGIN